MEVGEIYKITFNTFTDKYVVTTYYNVTSDCVGVILRRVTTAKTKIDYIRRPETLTIVFHGHVNPSRKNKKLKT